MQRIHSFQKLYLYRKFWILGMALALGALFVGGCMPAASSSDLTETATSIPQDNDETIDPPVDSSPIPVTPSGEKQLDLVDLSQLPDNLVTGEVPQDLLDEILADLAAQLDDTTQEIQVIHAEAVIWNDGSLGCPQPGMAYTQALVDGYWVILQVEGTNYDYRVSKSGYFSLCDGKGGLPISPPGDIAPKE